MALDDLACVVMDEWHQQHADAAHAQGWDLCETGHPGHSGIEVKSCLTSEDDSQAVSKFRQAFDLQEDHALAAYRIIQRHSTQEFMHWDMSSWREKTD